MQERQVAVTATRVTETISKRLILTCQVFEVCTYGHHVKQSIGQRVRLHILLVVS